ncbi:hypothetical protein EV363DRAFT_1447027 [Boletus edulis]|nr:hypothetical protein EV363DRAFT_1447027 [Boletus edulis]
MASTQNRPFDPLLRSSVLSIAKAELAKVKKQREFDLEVINIQDKGREKWKKKYVYWIPALHLDGKEIAKGRWDASTVLEALKQREATLDSQQSTE